MGYNVATTLSVSKQSGSSEENVKGSLQVVVKAIAAAGAGSVDVKNVDQTFLDNVSVRIVGDLELASLPQSLEELSEFNRKLPERVQNCNGGWGVPKKVFLTPLTYFTALANPLHVNIADIKTATLNRLSTLMVDLEELIMRCEEFKILNRHQSGYWSAKTNVNLRSFGLEVEHHIITIQDKLRPALNKLYVENDEGDVLTILKDSQNKESECWTLRTEGAKWLSSVGEHIEHLHTTADHIKLRLKDDSRVQLRWTSPLSSTALTTELLKSTSPKVVRMKQEACSRDHRRVEPL